MGEIRKWFSERTIFAPFGRYEGARRSDEPANQVLIGREKQRARLLNLLFTSGRTGACLVTGQRGSGKTSFARYCLEEYRRNVFRRWLATNVGRPFFWDRVGNLLIVGILPIAGLLLISQLMQATLGAGGKIRLLELLVLLVLSLVGFFPLLAAHQSLSLALRGFRLSPTRMDKDRTGDWPRSKPWPILGTLILMAGILFYPASGSPVVALGQLLFLSGMLALCGSLLSLSSRRISTRRNRDDALHSVQFRNPRLLISQVVGLTPTLLLLWLSSRKPPAGSEEAAAHLHFYVSATVLALGLSFLSDYWSRSAIGRWFRRPEAPKHHGDFGFSIKRWNVVSGALLILPGLVGTYWFFDLGPWHGIIPSLPYFPSPRWLAWSLLWSWVLAAPVYLSLSRFWWLREREKSAGSPRVVQNTPPINLLLLLKTLGLLVLGLQVGFPLFAFLGSFLKANSHLFRTFLGWFNPPPEWMDGSLFLALGLNGSPGRVLFDEVRTDLLWIAAGVSFLVVIGTLEFIWIVRGAAQEIEDSSLHRPPILPRGRRTEPRREDYAVARDRFLRDLSRSTFFYNIFDAWLPVLVVNVNLGFDDLQYRRVVEAMLAGLRGAYHETFLHWRRPFVAGKKIIVAGVLLFCTFQVGDFVFDATHARQDSIEARKIHNATYCSWALEASASGLPAPVPRPPRALWLTCKVGGEGFLQALQWRPLHRSDNSSGKAREASGEAQQGKVPGNLLFVLFENNTHPFLQLRVYHLLTFLLLWFVFRALARQLPIGLHRETYRRMTELHEHLSASIREELPPEIAGPVSVFNAFFRRKVRHKAMDPFDPRTVEVQFQRTLEELQDRDARLPFAPNHRVSLPTPDIIFVFDELDKIGVGRVVTPLEPGTEPGREAAAPMIQGRERAQRLHKLFGDLKNLLSCARARFIFLGARNLHDETLADYTDRNPLLSNIFEEDIYLPSLLGDSTFYRRQQVKDPCFTDQDWKTIHSPPPAAGADPRALQRTEDETLVPREDHYLIPPGIDFFLVQNLWRCQLLYEQHQRKRTRSWLAPWEEVRHPLAYVRSGATWFARPDADEDQEGNGSGEEDRLRFHFVDPPEALETAWAYGFRRDFLQFLAYRSLGNVKRLRSLMESFVEPKGRVLDPAPPSPTFECDHVLTFNDVARYRVQIVASIYRELMPAFEDRISGGDDKLVTEILYLSDFVLKFHRRGFTWSNLGRLDELVHIHRAPELRRVMEQVIVAWSNRFLHPIRNGMYDYRFESSFAREVAYISERSERELAAFNFTLDESQALKAIFQARLKNLGEESSQEFIAGLGELHEFDEEFEMARYHYRHAIQLLDQQFHASVASADDTPALLEALKMTDGGKDGIRLRASWGVSRVRLLLQIAMSFEQSHEHEQAQVEYRNALTLSLAVIHSLLDATREREGKTGELRSTLKHLNLLFQPAFAEAWVWEKLSSGVDTAPTLLEDTLEMFREVLSPFIHRTNLDKIVPAKGPHEVQHANFGLIIAELHDKAGDLYFFKGKDAPPIYPEKRVNRDPFGGDRDRLDGYLHRAYLHYATALHEVRRFNVYRRISSGWKFSVPHGRGAKPTFEEGSWPDFPFRAAAGAFADLGECALTRLPFWGLLLAVVPETGPGGGDQLGTDKPKPPDSFDTKALEGHREAIFGDLDRWLECDLPAWPLRGAGKKVEVEVDLWRLGIASKGATITSRKVPDICFLLGRWIQEERSQPSWSILEDYRDEERRRKPDRDPRSLEQRLDEPAAQKVFCLHFGGRSNPHPLIKYPTMLSWSLACSLYSAELLNRAGYHEASAREHLRVAHTVTCYVWWFRAVQELTRQAHPAQPKDGLERRRALLDRSIGGLDWSNPSLGNLFRHAVLCLEAALEAFVRQRPWTWSGGQRPRIEVAEQVPPELLTQACWLAMLLARLPADGKGEEPEVGAELARLKEVLAKIWPEWTRRYDAPRAGGTGPPGDRDGSYDRFEEALFENIARHSYPLRDRLLGLHVLLGQAALAPDRIDGEEEEARRKRWKATGDHVIEFLKLKKHYSSSLYFTPTQSGVALAALGLRLIADKRTGCGHGELHPAEQAGISLASILRVARQDLQLAREIHSMKRGYYEAISGLYYLYDDFNDRTIHYNHALQMAGSELTAVLLELIEDELNRERCERAPRPRREDVASPDAATGDPGASPESPSPSSGEEGG